MEIYTLSGRDKKLMCLCLALVAFWIIFIIGAAICLVYCVQLVSLGMKNTAVYALIFASAVVAVSVLAGALVYVFFYFARYKNKSFVAVFDGRQFIICDGETRYTFTREDIISHAKTIVPRLIGKYDLQVKVKRFTVDGDVVIGTAQFTLIQICEKSLREQTIKTFGIK